MIFLFYHLKLVVPGDILSIVLSKNSLLGNPFGSHSPTHDRKRIPPDTFSLISAVSQYTDGYPTLQFRCRSQYWQSRMAEFFVIAAIFVKNLHCGGASWSISRLAPALQRSSTVVHSLRVLVAKHDIVARCIHR